VSETGISQRVDMAAPGPGVGSRIASVLRGLLAMGAMGLLAAALMPLFHPLWPLASVAEHFAIQVLAGAILLALLALALRRWRWLALVLGIGLMQVWIIHPYWPALNLVMTPMNNETRLKIVSLNVLYRSDAYQSVRDYLTASNADVIGLVEVTPIWKAELASLRTLYPYSVDCVGAGERCEQMLLSKRPFLKSGAGLVERDLPVVAWAEIAPPDGTGPPLTIAVTHLAWPFLGARPAATPADRNQPLHPDNVPHLAQGEQAENLLGGLRQFGDNLVLMGDFNAAPWSRLQQHLRAESGLDNQGFLVPSWPAWGPMAIRLPIDHILTRGEARILSFAAGPDVGSDHLPVEAVVSLAR
jgi:endonuclease/exonuclease/phosphatase (EEP) superfamily protein YafD